MKKNDDYTIPVLQSLILHLGVVAIVLALRFQPYEWKPRDEIYQVELISAAIVDFPVPAPVVTEPQPEPAEPVEVAETEEAALVQEKPDVEEPLDRVVEPEPDLIPEPVSVEEKSKKAEIKPESENEPIQESKQLPAEETETADSEKPVTAVGNGAQFSIEAADFPSPYYLNLLRTRIQHKWRPPPRRNKTIQAVVSFRILRSGRFMDVGLSQTSGNGMFDLAAQRAIHAAGPLPPLPANFSGPYLTVHIEFEGL